MTDSLVAISLLDEDTINQIAAGEVVERPASVVKELVENAVDAQAQKIEIYLENGGIDSIEVSDDGFGIAPEQMQLALSRHATSKITSIADLDGIISLGFRGEALASIASVSQFSIQSRQKNSNQGSFLFLQGEHYHQEPIGCPFGTKVTVKNLFHNVPARKKFLRTASTERSHIVETVLRIGLGARKGNFIVKEGQRVLLNIPHVDNENQRVHAAIGKNTKELYQLPMLSRGDYSLEGFFTAPDQARRDAKGVYVFVNGRMVRDRLLISAVREGYRTLLPHDRYPIVALYLGVQGAAVDVNVHPQKTQVRFTNPQHVFQLVSSSLATALAHAPWIQSDKKIYTLHNSQSNQDTSNSISTHTASLIAAPKHTSVSVTEQHAQRDVWDQEPANPAAQFLFESYLPQHPQREMYFSKLRYIGQLHNTYLLCEDTQGGLVIVDQHAAHERIRMQQLVDNFEKQQMSSQALLFPESIELTGHEFSALESVFPLMQSIGLDIEAFGDTTVVIRSVPQGFSSSKTSLVNFMREVATAIIDEKGQRPWQDYRDKILASCACHGAIKAGDRLTVEEAQMLLDELDLQQVVPLCPHGRNIFFALSLIDLEKGVNRR